MPVINYNAQFYEHQKQAVEVIGTEIERPRFRFRGRSIRFLP